ncbi:MAG: Fur family transcriptional regulator [Actinomycetota bacterium]
MTSPRSTRQRAAIGAALKRAKGFRSAQQLHEELRAKGHGVGLVTVYRTLHELTESGEVDVLNAEGESIFRLCESRDHHHHLVCRSCGRSVEIASDELEAWAKQVARRHGFSQVSHVTELFGLCSKCR